MNAELHLTKGLAVAARTVVLRHPSSFAAEAWRPGDQAEAAHTLLGQAMVLFVPATPGSTELVDQVIALVEPVAEARFDLQASDLLIVYPGGGLSLPFVVGNPQTSDGSAQRRWPLELRLDFLQSENP